MKNITADEVLGTLEHTMKFRDFKAMLNKGDAKKFLFQYPSFRVGGQGIVLDKEVITLSLSNDDSLDSYFKTIFSPCGIHPLELKDEYVETFGKALYLLVKPLVRELLSLLKEAELPLETRLFFYVIRFVDIKSDILSKFHFFS